ncbi:MAG TPA: FliA/WhiG family RNA polymerase sigma factor [Bacteroidota bacterium]|nr:FliA/WhiG family RNA polymerase sigma factor [Bacteroidota bacterium]
MMTVPAHRALEYRSECVEATIDPTKEMIASHLGLVRYVASRFGFVHSGNERVLEESDLIQFGLIGLLDAIEKFDPAKGVRFETYAVTRIRGAVLDELRKLDWIPRSVRKKGRQANRIVQESESPDNQSLTAQEIASKLSLTLEEYKELLTAAKGATMDHRVSFEDEVDVIQNIAADPSTDPFEILTAEDTRSRLIEALESLNERDRLVMALYYYEELTFREIGKILRISESRVFQIHSSVLNELRKHLAETA